MLKIIKKWPLPHMVMFLLISLHNFFVTAGGYLLALALDEFQGNSRTTYAYIGGFVLLELFGVGVLFWNNCIEEKTKSKIRLHVRNQIAENVTEKTMRQYKESQVEQYVNEQISSVPDFSAEYLDNVYNVISNVEIVVFGTYFFMRLYPALAVGLIIAILLAAVVSKACEDKIEELSEQIVMANEKHLGCVRDVFAGLVDIRLYGVGDYFKEKTAAFSKEYEKEKWIYRIKHQSWSTVMYFPMFAIDMLLLVLVIYGINTGQTGIGTLAAFLSMEGLILNNGEEVFECILCMKSGKTMLPEYVEIGKEETDIGKAVLELAERGSIQMEAEDIEFSYEGRKLFKSVRITFEHGKKYILSGPSGSGKSTLFGLMTKELLLEDGTISYYRQNGEHKEIAKLPEQELFCDIGYLSQSGHLFKDTVYYNIFFDNEVAEEKQRELLEACCLNEVLKNREDGLNTIIEKENGIFSSGEQQRIRVARLLAQKKGLYLLDEPFCGIDEECAKKIEQYLLKQRNATFVMISHEQQMQKNADWEVISIYDMRDNEPREIVK